MAVEPLADPRQESFMRVEQDLLGDFALPVEVYYGVQTARALDNFQITGVTLSQCPHLVICSLKEDADLWLKGLSKAGVAGWESQRNWRARISSPSKARGSPTVNIGVPQY